MSTTHGREQNVPMPPEDTAEDRPGVEGEPAIDPIGKDLLRIKRPIVLSTEASSFIDATVVAAQYYNSFNYSILSKDSAGVNVSVGITSPNMREGKTLVASNLAVSLALANQRETVLVDLNLKAPRIHSIFGTPVSPGLVETLYEGPIHLFRSRIKGLYVLGAGGGDGDVLGNARRSSIDGESTGRQAVRLEHLAAFRDVIYSLKEQFEFVVIDMPCIREPDFPILFAGQLDGLILVVDAGKTKRTDIDSVFRLINQHKVMGFILNHVAE